MSSPAKAQQLSTRQHFFDPSDWFVHQLYGAGAQIVESECRICRLPIGAATHQRATAVMELSHVAVQHPHGLLRWFLQVQQFPPA